MEQMTKILIVEDHPLLRAGITKVLSTEPTFQIVGEAETGKAALDLADKNSPDVVLLDLNLPDYSGIEVCRILTQKHPVMRVIILTISDDENLLIGSIRAGACGYLLKDVAPDTLIEAIKATCQWGCYLHPGVVGKLITDWGKLNARVRKGNTSGLTMREVEVLLLIAKGRTNKEIAKELFISEKTVKNHITNIFRKLNVTDRTEAVVQAMKKSII